MRTPTRFFVASMALGSTLSLATGGALIAQTAGDAALGKGTLERVRVLGASLEGNLEGDDPARDVVVYLPPSYAQETTRRYPVVYFLHGYSVGAEAYVRFVGLPESADRASAAGGREMILVLPDAYTVYSGSMYSNSPTTGDWEGYVSADLVGYVDSHYRTLPTRNSRGLAGHSMGGYGTMRIGMKHPETFAALYAMSACCLMNDPARGGDAVLARAREGNAAAGNAAVGAGSAAPGAAGNRVAGNTPARDAPTGDTAAQPPAGRGGGFTNAMSAQAAAWAPNPNNPPQYFDSPIQNGELVPLVYAKWLANSPLVMVDQYVPSLRRYRAIAIDVGNADPLGADNVRLDAALTRLGVEHTFEQYEGDHMNRVGARFEAQVLPFFSAQLEF